MGSQCCFWKAILPPIPDTLKTPASYAAARWITPNAAGEGRALPLSGTSGLREAWFGNTDEARRRATLALKLSSGRDLQYFAALAFAYARDDARAKALADNLDKSFPEDTIVQFNYLPSVRGKLALNKGDASRAVARVFRPPHLMSLARREPLI